MPKRTSPSARIRSAPLNLVEHWADTAHFGAQSAHGAHLSAQPRLDVLATLLLAVAVVPGVGRNVHRDHHRQGRPLLTAEGTAAGIRFDEEAGFRGPDAEGAARHWWLSALREAAANPLSDLLQPRGFWMAIQVVAAIIEKRPGTRLVVVPEHPHGRRGEGEESRHRGREANECGQRFREQPRRVGPWLALQEGCCGTTS
jgi:hypothetical protein